MHHISIVDEDRGVLEGLCKALHGHDRVIDVHSGPEAAWASIDRELPDLVVLSATTRGPIAAPLIEDLLRHYGDDLALVVADSDGGRWEQEAGSLTSRVAWLNRSLTDVGLVQRTVNRLLEPPNESSEEAVDAAQDEGSAAVFGPARPAWESSGTAVLDALVDGVLITDLGGRLEYLNPAAARLLDVHPSDVLRRPISSLSVDPAVQEVFATVGEDDRARSACVHRRRSEQVLEVSVSRFRGVFGSEEGWFVGLRDIRDDLRAEQLRSHYLTVVSHELRTPLTVMQNLTTLLARDGVDHQAEWVQALGQQIRRLEHQVDKLLLLASRGQPRTELVPEVFDAREVIEEAVDSVAEQCVEKDVQFRWSPPVEPVWACAIPDEVRRATYELAENAVKFTPPGGVVTVTVSEGDDSVEVAVGDTGIGIDPEYHEAIFDEFRQLESPLTRTYGGAGLGLSLARGLAEGWGGRIDVSSDVGLGATFTLHVPPAPVTDSEALASDSSRMESHV